MKRIIERVVTVVTTTTWTITWKDDEPPPAQPEVAPTSKTDFPPVPAPPTRETKEAHPPKKTSK